ncbi:MAG: ribonuclease HI family protein [Nitrospinota bacterium]|nr:ribonuclease HI family protein [Nitrospinota bacterium]
MNSQAEHLLIHTDGAARGNPGPAGAAAVLYDGSGACVAEVFQYLGEATNNVAEYRGLLLGLKRAKEIGAGTVEIVTDSELLAKQWNGEYRVKNKTLRPLFDEAKEIAGAFESVEVRHVRRGGNAAADEAANRAIDEQAGV